MQVPTSVQNKTQVLVKVDNQLTQKVCKSALKNFPQREKRKERKGLANEIAKDSNRTNLHSETVHDTF